MTTHVGLNMIPKVGTNMIPDALRMECPTLLEFLGFLEFLGTSEFSECRAFPECTDNLGFSSLRQFLPSGPLGMAMVPGHWPWPLSILLCLSSRDCLGRNWGWILRLLFILRQHLSRAFLLHPSSESMSSMWKHRINILNMTKNAA